MEIKNAYIILGGNGTIIDNCKDEEYNYNSEKIATTIANNPTPYSMNLCPLISVQSALKMTFDTSSRENSDKIWEKLRETDEIDKKHVFVCSFYEDQRGDIFPIKDGSGIVNFESFSRIMKENGIGIMKEDEDEFVDIDYITQSLDVPQLGIINKTLIEEHNKTM